MIILNDMIDGNGNGAMPEENNEMPNSNEQQEHHPNVGHDDHNNQDMENENSEKENQ
ncbi:MULTISPECIES: hypothetical protein [unclassified Spiroplasma]|uniref:hypothetical protein n=1 Tax=unclassified Spiroplasma TaxID=2637901 RepID=UPI00313C3C1B